jgi:hypothetical protein
MISKKYVVTTIDSRVESAVIYMMAFLRANGHIRRSGEKASDFRFESGLLAE